MGATEATVLGKTDTAVRSKLTGFDLASRCFNEAIEFPALLFGDRCLQILDLGLMFSHEHHKRNI